MSVPRRSSRDLLLAYAWDAAGFSTSEAMATVGLSRSTTIEGLEALVAAGLLCELPNAREAGDYRSGRPSRRFELYADAGVVVGVDAGRWHVVTSVADLRGRSRAFRRTPAGPDDSAARRRSLVAAEVDAALAEAGRGRSSVLAVCVGVPAPVDRSGRSPAHREGFWDRMNPGLAEALSWCPTVVVENDASLAAVAEQAHGAAAGLLDTVTLLAGERLGAGVVVDGQLLRGAHGGVGELVVARHLREVDSSHGFAYQLASWARDLTASGRLPKGHPWRDLSAGDITARHVFDLAAAGDPTACSLVERLGVTIARIAGVLASLYDPSCIIIAGAIAEGIEPALVVARRLLPAELDLPTPDLIPSTLGPDIVTTGAIARALHSARAAALAHH